MDLTAIQVGLTSVQAGIELTKILSSASGTLERAEQKLKLAAIMSALADAKVALAAASEQISDLDQKLRRKENLGDLNRWFSDGLYVTLDIDGKAVDGPFCARCFDVDDRLIRPANDRTGERGLGYCPQCKNKYPLWNAEKRMIDDGALVAFTR